MTQMAWDRTLLPPDLLERPGGMPLAVHEIPSPFLTNREDVHGPGADLHHEQAGLSS